MRSRGRGRMRSRGRGRMRSRGRGRMRSCGRRRDRAATGYLNGVGALQSARSGKDFGSRLNTGQVHRRSQIPTLKEIIKELHQVEIYAGNI